MPVKLTSEFRAKIRLHRSGVVREAMEHAAHAVCERLQLRQRIFQRVALVNDAVQSEFSGDFKVLPEQFGLSILVSLIVGSSRTGLFAGQMMVVQPGFAERDDFARFREFTQRTANISGGLQSIGRMPAHDRVNAIMTFRKGNRPLAAFQVCADGNDFRDAGSLSALDYLREVRLEIRIIQMRVCVVKDGHG